MQEIRISVLTIVKSRSIALANLIEGLNKGDVFPGELIIVNMNEDASELTSDFFNVRSFRFDSDENIPLAAARNFAAAQVTSPFLVFLDVDCIPSKDLIFRYRNAFQTKDQLWAGPVRYLKNGATSQQGFLQYMEELSIPDPVRGDLTNLTYELFWSLNFGCSRQVYDTIGGFDDAFKGYGAEDTDFAFTARVRRVTISAVDAVAYHQYHPSYDPPLNHFDDIIFNAKTFFKKWSMWPMEGWLRKFELAGLIVFEENDIRILRKPDVTEIAVALKAS